MVALIAKADALSGVYSFLICCFSCLANCLDSLHGVMPKISAMVESGPERKMEESACAKEKAYSGEPLELFSGLVF